MKLFAFLALIASLSSAFSQSKEEEALILNQELEFLENSVKDIRESTGTANSEIKDRKKALNEESLESLYFGESERDEVTTKSSSTKRRGF